MRFRTHDSCIYYGEGCREEQISNFLLMQEELQEHNATDGYHCFPICMTCFSSGKTVVMYTARRLDLMQAQKEKAGEEKAAEPRK